ncbi:CLUMA_CG005629, isoform A [Clunio marinus]|uniref:CLUMA_CG005629, isoform A n=1 Tax=Clunio marinus TaxID=568069 RepID=A0A1J1I101_9DIPT|nr:CLUMA_CG005629, isoform A [Clunio marinus]
MNLLLKLSVCESFEAVTHENFKDYLTQYTVLERSDKAIYKSTRQQSKNVVLINGMIRKKLRVVELVAWMVQG